jgi:hypothetical protein
VDEGAAAAGGVLPETDRCTAGDMVVFDALRDAFSHGWLPDGSFAVVKPEPMSPPQESYVGRLVHRQPPHVVVVVRRGGGAEDAEEEGGGGCRRRKTGIDTLTPRPGSPSSPCHPCTTHPCTRRGTSPEQERESETKRRKKGKEKEKIQGKNRK